MNDKKRILAFIIDYLVSIVIVVLVGSISEFNIVSTSIKRIYGIILIISVFNIYFKDIIKGQSFGKRILKLRVVDENGQVPNLFFLILRNITLIVWPVEVILFLLDKPRIGDKIAKTKVK